MTFDLQSWSRSTTASNAGPSSQGFGGMAVFTYQSATDNLAAIGTANYFAEVVYELSLKDLVYLRGTDGVKSHEVTAIDKAAGTVTTTLVSLGV